MLTTEIICIILSIVCYLGVVVAIGIRCSKRNKTTDDFYLGGRKLGPVVTAMSAEASDMSSWLLMGLPGVAYLSGMADAGWTAIGLALGTYLNWLIVAKRIRVYSHRLDAITIPQFFSRRFGVERGPLTTIAAVIILIFFIPYTASGFAACGKLFQTLFGFDYVAAMVVSGIVIVAYTTLGGFLAASTTDFMQSIVMSGALVVILLFGVNVAGGVDVVIANANALPGYLSMTFSHNAIEGTATPYGFITIISTLAWGLGYCGMPHILLRFMAIEDEGKLGLSRRIATGWVVISMAVALCIGVIGYSASKAGALEVLTATTAETVIVRITSVLATYGIPAALLAGVVLAGILASTMSTADSQLLTAASAVSQNIVGESMGIALSEKRKVAVARFTVVVIALAAMLMARDPNSSVFSIVSFAWAGFGATFGPVMLFALFWKRTTKEGALAGMISGGLMIFLWKYCIRPLGGGWDIYELLPAFLVSVVVIWIVSLATPKPDQAVETIFDEVRAV